MNTRVVVFPFDAFGSGGTGAGAELLSDVLREAAADTELEPRPTRPAAYAGGLHFEEVAFDTLEAVAGWRAAGRTLIADALKVADFTVWLAGNHLGVLPVYEELAAADLVVQLDAHLDCYDLHDITDAPSHGNFLLHAASLPKVVTAGHRDLFLPAKDIRKTFAAAYPAEDFAAAAAGIAKRAKKAPRIWIDIDADVFDPAACPAVHQPLPCGPSGLQVLSLLRGLDWAKVAGVSVSEFDPGRDDRDRSLNLLGWLLEWVLLAKCGA